MLFVTPIESETDRAFFEGVYEQYKRLLYATALRYTINQEDCEDIVQDSVERLAGKVKRLRGLSSRALPSYLVYTVKNTALNFCKHQSVVDRHIVDADDAVQENCEVPELSPEELLERKERRVSLLRVWEKLSDREQELLYQKYILDQSDEEIAEMLRCKKDSVRVLLMRARRKAAELLEKEEHYDKT